VAGQEADRVGAGAGGCTGGRVEGCARAEQRPRRGRSRRPRRGGAGAAGGRHWQWPRRRPGLGR
jgi:hypothetical protein